MRPTRAAITVRGDTLRTITMLGATVLATAGTGLIAPPAMAATAITCGATVTGAAYLAQDLTCADDGVIVADNTTLDLRGHRFSGPKTSEGITITGSGAVRILNGRLSGWGTAVRVDPDAEGDDNSLLVDRLSFTDNGSGLGAGNAGSPRSVLVQRSRFTGNSTGVSASWARIDVHTSTFTGNDQAAYANTGNLHLYDSQLVGNKTGVHCDESICEVADSVLRNNTTGVNGVVGAYVILTDNSISGSTVAVKSSDYFSIGGGGELSRNQFSKNKTAVEIDFGVNLTLTDNTFTRNTSAVTTLETVPGDLTSASLTGNSFTRNGDAINLLIPVQLKQNSATYNTGWGIYAPNATDLGGNTAHHNGKSPQCTGVVCS
jgi:hypothetical protein